MKVFNASALVIGAGLALSGCGVQAALATLERVQEADTIISDLTTLGAATTENMPESGTGAYTGIAVIEASEGTDGGIVLTGDASVDADFAASTMSGEISSFVGARLSETELAEAEAAAANGDVGALTQLLNNFGNASGSLTLANGTIVDTDFTLDADGTLRFKGTEYVVDATVDGSFAGAAEGLQAESTTITVTADGTALTDATLLFGATGTVTP